MRRIIHNSTAIAACLSLLAPHLASAQQLRSAPAAASDGIVLAQADAAPSTNEAPPAKPEGNGQADAANSAAEEIEAQEPAAAGAGTDRPDKRPETANAQAEPDPEQAEAANTDAAPEAPAEAAAEPQEGDAPDAEGDGAEQAASPVEEPNAADAEAASEGQADADAQVEEQTEDLTEALREAETEAGNAAPEGEAAGQQNEAAPQAEEPAEDLSEALREAETEAQAAPADAEAPAAEEPPAARPAQAPAAPANAEAEAEELGEALREAETADQAAPAGADVTGQADAQADTPDQPGAVEAQTGAEAQIGAEGEAGTLEDALRAAEEQAPAAAAPAAPAAPAAGEGLRLATGNVQRNRAGNMSGLAGVLEEELGSGMAAGSLTCLDGGSFPCGDGRAMTPRGVVVETNEAGELRLAPVEAQMYRVGENGELVQRAAEEDTPETEVSREAAEAGAPVAAAALDAAEGQGEVTEQTVTEETARSSSEEFETNLRDALAAATGQPAEARQDDDGDDNDLTRALLLGLGAVAVGSYLNNNRQVALSTPDRVVVTRPDGSQEIIKDEVALLRQPGSTVTTENFDDGSSRTIVTREDGSRVVTIRDANLRVLRRTLVSADGQTTQLIDETADVQPVDVSQLPAPAPVQNNATTLDEAALREALQREANFDRQFTLSQIRNIPEVRALVAPVNIDAITFDTGSAAIRPDQAQQLQTLGSAIRDAIAENPQEIFMIEGHTDTVGSDAANLALSDRRAESVALALSEYFDVPPENMVTQGYGEQFPRVRAEGDIRDNRRASVRRITDLLAR